MKLDERVEAQPLLTPGPTPSWAMLRTLGGIAAISGLLVVLVYQLTAPIIAENQRVRTERAVFKVIPGAVEKRDLVLTDQGLVPAGQGAQGEAVYAAYDAAGRLLGVAFPGAAQGYADVIRFLFGYDPGCQCIVGMQVLKSTETPGLGDKIATDPAFLANFRSLEARLDPEGLRLANAIETVKHGTKNEPWQIDAISGATISSVATGRALNKSAQRLVPAVHRSLDVLQSPGETTP
jgi:Na+-translocating ferredoxin:NAD+ oxidoreductase subunit G